jgi:hypothetical protein
MCRAYDVVLEKTANIPGKRRGSGYVCSHYAFPDFGVAEESKMIKKKFEYSVQWSC